MRFDPDSSRSRPFTASTVCRARNSIPTARTIGCATAACASAARADSIFSIPSRLTEDARAPRLALTRVEVMGVPVPSTTPYWLLDRIAVDYRASIVSLDFGALDFIRRKRNRLAYRMAGLSDRWIDLGTQHRVTLTNLDAGDHLLEVRAANADSVWSDPPLRLTIHRDPAPWRSPLGLRGLRAARAPVHRLPRADAPRQDPARSSARRSAWNRRSRCARASWSRAIGSWRRRRGRRAISSRG